MGKEDDIEKEPLKCLKGHDFVLNKGPKLNFYGDKGKRGIAWFVKKDGIIKKSSKMDECEDGERSVVQSPGLINSFLWSAESIMLRPWLSTKNVVTWFCYYFLYDTINKTK